MNRLPNNPDWRQTIRVEYFRKCFQFDFSSNEAAGECSSENGAAVWIISEYGSATNAGGRDNQSRYLFVKKWLPGFFYPLATRAVIGLATLQ